MEVKVRRVDDEDLRKQLLKHFVENVDCVYHVVHERGERTLIQEVSETKLREDPSPTRRHLKERRCATSLSSPPLKLAFSILTFSLSPMYSFLSFTISILHQKLIDQLVLHSTFTVQFCMNHQSSKLYMAIQLRFKFFPSPFILFHPSPFILFHPSPFILFFPDSIPAIHPFKQVCSASTFILRMFAWYVLMISMNKRETSCDPQRKYFSFRTLRKMSSRALSCS